MGCVCNMNKQGVLGELCQATKCEFRIWPDDMYHDTVVTIYYMVMHCNIVSLAIYRAVVCALCVYASLLPVLVNVVMFACNLIMYLIYEAGVDPLFFTSPIRSWCDHSNER